MNIHPTIAQTMWFAPPHSAIRRAARDPEMTVAVGGIGFRVVYDHTPAERPICDVNSPVCGPGHAAEVEILEAWVGDNDLTDLLSESTMELIAGEVLARIAEGEA